MEDYSIESAISRINDARTKVYFQEVFSSYVNGNYRSAIVMLWSVVICDLIYKLQHLRDIDNDSIARSILERIERKQQDNPKNPEWEAELLKQVRDRTELLDHAEHQNLIYLQDNRHLSAHPVLGESDLLFSPNKETVRAIIRNALDAVLLKPPILTKKISEAIVLDLAEKRDVLIKDDDLRRYLEARYLRNLKFSIESHLFRTLWKFVFQLMNENTNINRQVNFRTIKVLYVRHPAEVRRYIENHRDYFSNISTGEPLSYLIDFLGEAPTVYNLLNDSAKVLINNMLSGNLNLFSSAYFLNESFQNHLEQIKLKIVEEGRLATYDNSLIQGKTFSLLYGVSVNERCEASVLDIAIESYVRSANFDDANYAFNNLIAPYLSKFSKSQLTTLLEGIEGNDQTWLRKKAQVDHKQLKERFDQVFDEGFDYSVYPNFMRQRPILKI